MQYISLDRLVVSKLNMRYNSTEEGQEQDEGTDVSTLADSIRSQGLLNPILVRPQGDLFEVYAGRRRLLAAKSLGMEQIACLVNADISDETTLVCSLIENYQRRETSYSEKIKTFSELYEKMDPPVSKLQGNINYTERVKRLCQLVGCRPKTLKRYLRISALPPNILVLLDKKESHFTLKCAELLLDVHEEHLVQLVESALQSKLSSVEFENLIVKFGKNNNMHANDLPRIINEIIEQSSQSRRPKLQVTSTDISANVISPSDEILEDVEALGNSNDEEDNGGAKENQSPVGDKAATEEVKEKVNKNRPWIYDPKDKSKVAKQIEPIYLPALWETYDKLINS